MKKSTAGLFALGLASVAYWYKGMTSEQRQNVKDKITGATKKFSDNMKSTVDSAKGSINTNAPQEV